MTTNPYQSPASGEEPIRRASFVVARVVAGCALLLIGVPALLLWIAAVGMVLVRREDPALLRDAIPGLVALTGMGIGFTTSGLCLLASSIRRAVPLWTAALWLATILLTSGCAMAWREIEGIDVPTLFVPLVLFAIFGARGAIQLIRRRPT